MFGVFRIRKYNNKRDLAGIEGHVERRATISYTNPQIDRSHSSQNYDLNGKFEETFSSQMKKRFKEKNIKPKRKDAVLMVELFFSATHEFFENMSPDEIRQYFQNCYDWAASKYGKENIVSAMVHLDETTPHLHLCFIPITKDDRLCANDYFGDGGKLSKLQDDIHEKVFSKYGLQRGELAKETKRKHVETLDWKMEQVKITEQQLNLLENQKRVLQKEVDFLQGVKDTDRLYQTQQKLNQVYSDLEKLKNTIRQNPTLAKEFIKVIDEQEQEKESKEIE